MSTEVIYSIILFGPIFAMEIVNYLWISKTIKHAEVIADNAVNGKEKPKAPENIARIFFPFILGMIVTFWIQYFFGKTNISLAPIALMSVMVLLHYISIRIKSQTVRQANYTFLMDLWNEAPDPNQLKSYVEDKIGKFTLKMVDTYGAEEAVQLFFFFSKVFFWTMLATILITEAIIIFANF